MCIAGEAAAAVLKISGGIGDGRDDRRGGQKWNAEPDQSIAREGACTLAPQTRIYEQPRDEEHQRHEEGVVEAEEQIEPGPMRVWIDYRKCAPGLRRGDKRFRKRRRR